MQTTTSANLEQQAMEIAERALYLYFVANDNEELIKLFSKKHTSWIGWAAFEDYLSYTAVYDTFTARIGEIPHVEMTNVHKQVLLALPGMYIVYVTCKYNAPAESGTTFNELGKYTFCIGEEEDGLKIWHLHSSAAWKRLRMGEYFPHAASAAQLEAEEVRLTKESLPASIAINTPNGLKCCKVEKNYPAIFINKALYTMAGYASMSEMQQATGGRLDKIIYSADLPRVRQAMATHTDGSVYTINYRLLRREGSPLWVLERGQCYTYNDSSDYFICSIAPLDTGAAEEVCYGSLVSAEELANPQVPVELWFKTALEIAASNQPKDVVIKKLLKLTADILLLPGAFISQLDMEISQVRVVYAYYDGSDVQLPEVLPYTPQQLLPSFNSSNVTQCSDVALMPKIYGDMLSPLHISAFYSVLINIDSTQYVLNFYQQNKIHRWTDNEKDLIAQLARFCKLLLK